MKVLSSVALAGLLLAASASQAQVPGGSYSQSCSGAQVAGNVLKAKCRTMSGSMVDTSLNLPCQGSIDNINGKLTCSGAPAANAPQGSYLQSCAEARVQDNTLHAKCRRANQTVADASLKLPCTGKIDNLNGVLTCVGGTAPPAPPTPTPTPVAANLTLTLTPPASGGSIQNCPGWDPYCIRCGQHMAGANPMTDCKVTKAKGSKIEMTAYPDDGWAHTGWTGACQGQGQRCTLVLDDTKAASATFGTAKLTVATPTNGTVTANPPNRAAMTPAINCGTSCTSNVAPGTGVTVQANPANGFVFDKWAGACAGKSNPCALTVSGDQNVTATFKSVGTTTVTATAPANGVIGGSGLNCGATCSAKVTSGSNFTVVASPASNKNGYVFDKWTGDCAGQGASCNLVANKDYTVGAAMKQVGTGTVTITSTGKGSVQNCPGWDPYCIRCGPHQPGATPMTDCKVTLSKGARVEMTGYPHSGNNVSWSGACAGQGRTCSFTLDGDKTVGANFP